MSGTDKIWAPLANKPIIWHSLARLSPAAAATVLVVRRDQLGVAESLVRQFDNVTAIVGGAERRDSVRLGLDALPQTDVIAVHDGARPFAPPRLLGEGKRLLISVHGAIPVVRLADTAKQIDETGIVMSTPNRDSLRGVQTPQLFRGLTLRSVHAQVSLQESGVTDDAALLELAGFPVMTFDGAPENFKITTEYDLMVARLLLESGAVAC